jgi:MinD-like ATPase involved in chromosome partitioning or flagellar assembly
MAPEEPRRPRRRKKLGRGLADISHVFLSGAEKRDVKDAPEGNSALWIPDVDVVSVTSGEGVHGKTFLSANLAFRFALEGYRVALANADPARPGILDITGVDSDQGDSGEFKSNTDFGAIPEVDLLGVPEPGSHESPAGLPPLAAIEKLATRVQRIIVDTSPAVQTGLGIWRFAKLVLVITEPSSGGMKSSYVTIKRVRAASPTARIGLVVNLAGDRDTAGRCHRKLSNVCRRFLKTNLRNYGYIVASEAVEECCRRAVPLARAYPGSKITECMDYVVNLIIMDHMAIARRRREVTVRTCASREGR